MTPEQRATIIADAEQRIGQLETQINGRKEHIDRLKNDMAAHENHLAVDEYMLRTQHALIAFIKTDADPA